MPECSWVGVYASGKRIDAFELAFGPGPTTNARYGLLEYGLENREKTGETTYFEIYE